MDWRAIELNEAEMDKLIAEAEAAGDKTAVAAGKLQMALLRPWLCWVAENRASASTLLEAFVSVMGAMTFEVARNAKIGGTPLSCVKITGGLLSGISMHALESAKEVDAGTYDTNSDKGHFVNLEGEADA